MKVNVIVLSLCFWILYSCSSIPQNYIQKDVGKPLVQSGINWGRPKNDPLADIMQVAGPQWVRVDFAWSRMEPRQGQMDFQLMDQYMAWCQSQNLKVLGVLLYDTPWIHDDNQKHKYIPPERVEDYLRFVEAIILRYGNQVQEWEIWNEPNMVFNKFWDGPDNEFIDLTQKTIAHIKEIDPDAYVLGGSVWRYDRRFIRKLIHSGALDQADALSFHPYYANPKRTFTASSKFIDYAQTLGFQGDFRITEMGYPTGGWYVTRVKPEDQAMYLWETYFYLNQLDIPYAIWFKLTNSNHFEFLNSEQQFGLFILDKNNEWSYKSGGHAIELYSRYFSSSSIILSDQIWIDESLKGDLYSLEVQNLDDEGQIYLLLITKKRQVKLEIQSTEPLKVIYGESGEENVVSGVFQLKRNQPVILIFPDSQTNAAIMSTE